MHDSDGRERDGRGWKGKRRGEGKRGELTFLEWRSGSTPELEKGRERGGTEGMKRGEASSLLLPLVQNPGYSTASDVTKSLYNVQQKLWSTLVWPTAHHV